MRLYFPNTSRPKKAAKHLANKLNVSLSNAQRAIAKSCGYRDWHELETQVSNGPAFELDNVTQTEIFVERQAKIITTAASELQRQDGDVQYALSEARLTGNRPIDLDEQIAIRLACWRSTSLPPAKARQRGAIGKLRTPGRNGETVILRHFGQPTKVISDREITTVADFEYVTPRQEIGLFLPARLYLPYGFWTEQSGARVIFSRDYKPLWRLRVGYEPERVLPWEWIKFTAQEFLWDDGQTPWGSKILKGRLISFLRNNGLNQLPILADCLPLLVHETSKRLDNMSDGVDLLKTLRGVKPAA